MEWWYDLEIFQQVSFVLAVASTLLLVVFIVMMLIGASGDSDFDSDVDTDSSVDSINDEPFGALSGLKLFTLRTGLAFFSIGGWVGYIIGGVLPLYGSIPLSVLAGTIAAVILAFVFRALKKLESEGNVNYRNGIGKTAIVYLRVPANKKGLGKVNLNIQDRFVEVNAVTTDLEDIVVGTQVKIVDVVDETTVVVSKEQ